MSDLPAAVVATRALAPWSPERAPPPGFGGQALTAVVLDVLSDGEYRVAIGESRYVLQLPAVLKPGESVVLRPPADAAGPNSALRSLFQNPSASQLLASAAAAPEPELGAAAQLVARLALAGPAPGNPGPAIGSTAPLSRVPGDASAVAAGLKKAIETSGLFYEAHLSDWVEGRGSNSGLWNEPQAALGAANATATERSLPESVWRLTPQAELLVQRQLEVLENRAVQWQGEAWPGQPFGLRIAQDDRDPDDRDTPKPGAWRASLRVSMPGLGNLEATLGLSGKGVRMAIRTTDAASARPLLDRRAELVQALGKREILLSDLRIEGDAGTDSR